MDNNENLIYLIVITIIKLLYELDKNNLLLLHFDVSGEQVDELLKVVQKWKH